MSSAPKADIAAEVLKLMNPEDEAMWLREGLFKESVSSEVTNGAHLHSTCLPSLCPLPCSQPLSSPSAPLLSTFSAEQPHLIGLPPYSHPLSSLSDPEDLNRPPEIMKGFISDSSRLHPFPSNQTGVRKKPWKPNQKTQRMVLGDDVGVEDTCRLALCGLVGRMTYSYLASCPVEEWMVTNWKPLIGYVPEILFLTKGWMGFICKSPEDASLLLSNFWVLGGSSLMLKRWRVAFDPQTKHFQHRHLWVLFLGLPLHFWNAGALKAIGEALGRFITFHESLLASSARKIARILVEIDLHSGLPELLDIDWRGRHFKQRLDYQGILFRCNRCRSTRHLRRDCPGKFSIEQSEDSLLHDDPPDYMTEADFLGDAPLLFATKCETSSDEDLSLSSKLKHFCPSFFSSLTLWERQAIENSRWL